MRHALKLELYSKATVTMRGVPWLPKDSLDYPGMPTTSCSRSRSRKAVQHGYPYVQRLQQAGLVALGKSAMPEFGLLASTEPLAGPVTRNPWSLEHSPGGSSGGAVAAIAAGLVPLAHGSDGGGSIRLPASCCGVVGLKPGRDSTVRVRARHVIEDLLVADSLHSRSVRDVAWGFAAAHCDPQRRVVTSPSSRRLRIAVIEHGLRGNVPHADVARAVTSTAELCATLGHKVERTTWPLDGHAFLGSFEDLWSHLAPTVSMRLARCSAAVAWRMRSSRGPSAWVCVPSDCRCRHWSARTSRSRSCLLSSKISFPGSTLFCPPW